MQKISTVQAAGSKVLKTRQLTTTHDWFGPRRSVEFLLRFK
jgi:hypothetical protein